VSHLSGNRDSISAGGCRASTSANNRQTAKMAPAIIGKMSDQSRTLRSSRAIGKSLNCL
jgi:hypothetical protein